MNEKKDSDGKKSTYQQKLRLKRGRGVVDPKWMWWLEDPANPRKGSPLASGGAR